jgi:hypothetical protein
MLGLCLVAVFAVAAAAATSASALPEWGQCFKKGAGGKYTDANCTKKATLTKPGEFEWRKSTEVANKKFSGGSVGSGGVLSSNWTTCFGGTYDHQRVPSKKCVEGGGEVAQISAKVNVECESEVNHGEATGSKEVRNVIVKFLGCKALGTIPCANGSVEGEITTNVLKGSLGYISKPKKEVGVLLEPTVKKGEFAKFSCAGQLALVVGVGNEKEGAAYSPEKTGGYDGIISPITPVNASTKTFTQVYTINEQIENIPSHFEGKHIELLEDYQYQVENPQTSYAWDKAGETITNVNTQESGEEAEIKA